MSRPARIPSHSGPPPSYVSYPPHHASASRPEIIAPGHQVRPVDSSGNQSNAQQLPSLRTLLEPELLDKKSSDPPPLSASGTQHPYTQGGRYGSSSPTLKRRHEHDSHFHGYPEHNAVGSQSLYHHRQSLPATAATPSTASSTSSSGFGIGRLELQRRESFVHPSQHDLPGNGHRQPSLASDSAGSIMGQQELGFDPSRPVRMRRLDGSSRAPIQSSRCVGQRDIPGEGLCYVYEDGTYCRAIIDGEAVNPSWGITKAGKPRKRLAQACLTCREKKIKCEPGYPKCHQCAKSQRVCRGGINQNNVSGETSPSGSAPLYKHPSSEVLSPSVATERARAIGEPREPTKSAVDPWNISTPYRPRKIRSTAIGNKRDMSVHSYDSDWSGSANEHVMEDFGRGSYSDPLALQWEQDPFETDPRLTMDLLELYFRHAGRATYSMFPRRAFLTWVETSRDKSQDHLMLLYSILAMGSAFAVDPERRSLGKRFVSVASYAAEKRFGKFSLQLCQTRLMLALYFFAKGKSQEAWDYCGAGLRAISALKLNTEDGIKDLADSNANLDYGFDRQTFEECCRRTFWSGLLMDVSYDIIKDPAPVDLTSPQRYNGFFGGTLFVFSMEDAFVRLPCLDRMYESSTPSDAPFFSEELLSGRGAPITILGPMAHLCLISTLWGEVLTFTGRAARRPDTGYERHYETFYAKTYEKLDAWHAMLPEHLRYTMQNLDTSIIEGYAGTFVSIHALYCATTIRLNRHVRINALPADKICRNLKQAFFMASNFLSMMHSIAKVNRQQRLPAAAASEFLFSTPFPGYALMLSVDVLTSAGLFSTLPKLIETLSTSLSCIDELASFWSSAKTQQKTVSHRIKQLTEMAAQEGQNVRYSSHGNFWRTNNSLQTSFANDDAMYKTDDQLLFGVVGQLTS
ncbi:hypothetical protein COCCADRAFT_86876 [Bipolaris zeicola 26-R-13]|uniref:Zn(2)-C6 fungal-type domain-containing protein n=1 Tax=Cochliobolus carbonum (strain 26-R-13) TaxID=930089 RepID=W6YBT8_COCC2|nr:uncharacterized protein COCCADRAFT_86876 [Bipolaris zeicola 26-R-13]EUC36977.1 hypothetical protein COCCADRAFT_86876 [Bipolaris zeicola 26-R-13]